MNCWVRLCIFFNIFNALWLMPAKAGNEHEHLQYLPSYEDILKASHGTLENIPSRELFANRADFLLSAIGQEWFHRLDPKSTNPIATLQALIDHTTVKQLAASLAKANPKRMLPVSSMERFFFEESALASGLESYKIASHVRSVLFDQHFNLFISSLEEFAKRTPQSDLNKVIASIQKNFETPERISRIHATLNKKGIQLQLYTSVTRSQLLDPTRNIENRLTKLKESFQNGLLSGIDISGSLLEINQVNDLSRPYPEYFGQRVQRILQFSKDNSLPIRIHAFEGANEGEFYSVFWRALEDCSKLHCLPPTIRIGHIQALGESDILRLKRYSNQTRFIFEANLESNIKLQANSDIKKLISTIETIHRNKMQVVLGADGFGIFGDSASFEATLVRLRGAGLSKSSLEEIIKNAFIPVAGTRVDRATLLSWQLERDHIRRHVFAQDYRPLGSKTVCRYGSFTQLLQTLVAKHPLEK